LYQNEQISAIRQTNTIGSNRDSYDIGLMALNSSIVSYHNVEMRLWIIHAVASRIRYIL